VLRRSVIEMRDRSILGVEGGVVRRFVVELVGSKVVVWEVVWWAIVVVFCKIVAFFRAVLCAIVENSRSLSGKKGCWQWVLS
jgi:hypothetical protein